MCAVTKAYKTLTDSRKLSEYKKYGRTALTCFNELEWHELTQIIEWIRDKTSLEETKELPINYNDKSNQENKEPEEVIIIG